LTKIDLRPSLKTDLDEDHFVDLPHTSPSHPFSLFAVEKSSLNAYITKTHGTTNEIGSLKTKQTSKLIITLVKIKNN